MPIDGLVVLLAFIFWLGLGRAVADIIAPVFIDPVLIAGDTGVPGVAPGPGVLSAFSDMPVDGVTLG
jgi:hypothetical protein